MRAWHCSLLKWMESLFLCQVGPGTGSAGTLPDLIVREAAVNLCSTGEVQLESKIVAWRGICWKESSGWLLPCGNPQPAGTYCRKHQQFLMEMTILLKIPASTVFCLAISTKSCPLISADFYLATAFTYAVNFLVQSAKMSIILPIFWKKLFCIYLVMCLKRWWKCIHKKDWILLSTACQLHLLLTTTFTNIFSR